MPTLLPPHARFGLLIALCAWLAGCAAPEWMPSRISGHRPDAPTSASAAAAAAATSTANGSTATPGAQPPGTAAPPAPPTATPAPNNATARGEQLNQIMAELQTLGALDPAAQAQLLADLQQTDPTLWPQMMQVFRASMRYRQRQAEGKQEVAAAAKSPASVATAAPTQPPPAPSTPASSTPGNTSTTATHPASNVVQAAAVMPAATPMTPANTLTSATVNPAANDASPAVAPANNSAVVPAVYEAAVGKSDPNVVIAQAISAIEEQSRDKSPTPEQLAQQVQLRMLYLMSGRKGDALRPIAGLAPNEQEFWTEQIYGLSTYLDASQQRDQKRRAADAATHLEKAVIRLNESGNLVVRNLAFCTEVVSYGVHTDVPKAEFKPNQQLLLYCEVENFLTEATAKGHHTSFKSSYQIVDAQGHRVAEHELAATEEHCQNVRRDYFLRYFLHLPQRIYPGKYTLQLTVEDTLGKKIGQSSIDFSIKE